MSHPLNAEYMCEEMHELQITKKIIETYVFIRLCSHGKKLTLLQAQKNSTSVTSKLTKHILFSYV